MLEGSTKQCPMCQGTGMVRSVESVALDILRSVEDRLMTDGVVPLIATTAVDVALYILNQKRVHLNDIQQRYRVPITIAANEDMHISQFVIERAAEGEIADGSAAVHMDWAHHHEAPQSPAPTESEGDAEAGRPRTRRRRRRRRSEGGGEPQRQHTHVAAPEPDEELVEDRAEAASSSPVGEVRSAEAKETGAQARRGPRRRGRRGGRRGRSGQRPLHASDDDVKNEVRSGAHEESVPASSKNAGQNGGGRERSEALIAAREVPPVTEPVAASATEPASESPAEGEGKAEGPRRRGWWQR
jgi:ribonuclease E